MNCVYAAGVAVATLCVTGCGGSHKRAFVCPASRGHSIVTPMTGRLAVLGRPPVEVRIDNRGDLRQGVAALGTTDYARWYALKSHFMTTPSYRGGFTVRVRALGGSGVVRIGGAPTGTTFRVTASTPPSDGASGWRDFVGGWTWARGVGCYEWD
ncbi:MAG: hypothetical protein ACRDPA_05660, partial [Solirubrobacteraceae bacterium]